MALFGVSATFHYFGPSLAVLLFAQLSPTGVTWLRIGTAAVVLGVWRRPWRTLRLMNRARLLLLVAMGTVLAGMNLSFYLAVERLPLSTVGAIEFLGVIALAVKGAGSGRNLAALGLAIAGVVVLSDIRLAAEPMGFVFALANCLGFMAYVALGHRMAGSGVGGGVDQLSLAMVMAWAAVTPVGLGAALPGFATPSVLLAGVAVGICCSVIPYVIDQVVMARMSRQSFAMLLCLLPAMATGIGLIVLGQIPTPADLLGIALVAAGLATHRPAGPRSSLQA